MSVNKQLWEKNCMCVWSDSSVTYSTYTDVYADNMTQTIK